MRIEKEIRSCVCLYIIGCPLGCKVIIDIFSTNPRFESGENIDTSQESRYAALCTSCMQDLLPPH